VIEFLIRLCETDPVALAASEQPGDLLNLAYGFYRFGLTMARDDLGESPTDSASRLASDIRADPAKHLQSIIRALSALLGAAVDGKTFEWVVQPKTKLLFRGSRNAQKAILFTPEGPHSLEQSVIFGAVQCLDGEEGRMVRRCRREVCRRIFLARRPKQIFCTRQCASAAAFERYKRERGEEVYRAEHRRTARASWRTKQRRLGRSVTPRIKDAAKSKGV
jgi:hypothetical protein